MNDLAWDLFRIGFSFSPLFLILQTVKSRFNYVHLFAWANDSFILQHVGRNIFFKRGHSCIGTITFLHASL